jgi:FAD/FMN-containing dehydrogenase
MQIPKLTSTLADSLGPDKVHSSGPGYEAARQRIFNVGVNFNPRLVVTPETTADVRAAVRAAVEHGVTLTVLAGGNDWPGRCVRGDVVIDLTRMHQVVVDRDVAVAQGGATLAQLADAAEEHGLAAATGTMGRVGVAGLTLGGGYGPLTGRVGMALDNLLGAEVVLADGRVIATDSEHEPDLFWALRGGGGNFGVVTNMRIQLHPIPSVSSGIIAFPLQQAPQVIHRYAALVAEFPDDLTETPAFVENPDGSVVLAILHAWSGDKAEDERIRDRVAGLGDAVLVRVDRKTPAQMLRDADALVVNGANVVCRTVTLQDLGSDAMRVIVGAMHNRPSPLSWIGVHPFHGAPERIPLESTAFGIRRRHFMVGFYALWRDGDGAQNRAWADAGEAALQDYVLDSAYPNYFGEDRPNQAAMAYGLNASRLLEVKGRYDPDHVFSATSLPDPLASSRRHRRRNPPASSTSASQTPRHPC